MAKAVQISDRIDVQAILQTSVAPQQGFGKNLFIIDSEEIPVDRRVAEVTRNDYADTFDSSGLPYAYAQTHFSQKRTPDSLLVGRWAKTASKTYLNLGAGYTATLATWTAITDGSFAVYEVATPATIDDVTGVNFSGATDISQIPGIIQAALQAIVAPNVTGLDTATCTFDIFGRLTITMPNTGASAATIAIKPVSPAAGTDIATHMDYTNGVPVAGLDAETITAAIDAIDAIDNSGYFVTAKFDDTKATKNAEILLFAAKIQSMEKIGIVLSDDVLIKDSSDTTNIFYQLKALNYTRVAGIYYENISSRPTMYPDSAGLGCVMPAQEGTTKFCQEALTGVGTSGYAAPLSKAQSDAVNGHGGMVVETVGGTTYWFDGLTFGGVEIRIMLGRDWFVTRIRESIHNYTILQPLTAFDNETLTALAGFVRDWGEKAIIRRILVDTVARPFTVNFPDADDFTQAERASHVLTAQECFKAYLNSAANEYVLTGTWTI